MFSCGTRGEISLLTVVPAGAVMDHVGDDPVVVHMTVCREHVRAARKWLAARTAEPIDTYSTEQLMREWGQVREILEDTPIFAMVQAV